MPVSMNIIIAKCDPWDGGELGAVECVPGLCTSGSWGRWALGSEGGVRFNWAKRYHGGAAASPGQEKAL